MSDFLCDPQLFTNTAGADRRIAFTPEGGFAIRLLNDTGANSIKGTLVEASTAQDNAFSLSSLSDYDCMGVVYENGIAPGQWCWIVVSGRAQVKLENNVGATHGNWVRTSATAVGRADATAATPPAADPTHFAEVGHCLETVAGSATGVLAWVMIHFN